MTLVHRVLYPQPIISLADFVKRRGGQGISAALSMEPSEIIEMIGLCLRGRGGAGFPTGLKWRTVADNRLADVASTVIVNAAEGEPGTFKDRTILRRNPYVVFEGALVAARAVGADLVVFAMKQSFAGEVDRTRAAIEEVEEAGWSDGVKRVVFEGPDEYLYGEESALLETIDGRWPFPRIVPTFRRASSPRRRSTRRRHRRWSTTPRPSPTWPASSPGAPPGSAAWSRRPRPGPWCAR